MMKFDREKLRQRLIDWKETAIIFGTMTAIMLPVRLVFFTYVSQDWISSFVIVAGISVAMLVLVKKSKLGWWGNMFDRQMQKMQHGKRAKVVYGNSLLFIGLELLIIVSINMGNTIYHEEKVQIETEHPELTDKDALLEQSKDATPVDYLVGLVALFLAIFVAFPLVAVMMAMINDAFGGWILHIYTTGLVESLLVFATLVYYRTKWSKKDA